MKILVKSQDLTLESAVHCIPLIRTMILSNENWPYKRDGLISEHYYTAFTWPQLGPPENWPYIRDGRLCVGLKREMHCNVI